MSANTRASPDYKVKWSSYLISMSIFVYFNNVICKSYGAVALTPEYMIKNKNFRFSTKY